MTLKERIKEEMKEAMRAKDAFKRDTLRTLTAAIKQIEVDERIELDDAGVEKVVMKAIKQRQDAAGQYKDGDRMDLAEKEEKEAEILAEYLPKQLTDEELESTLKAIIEKVGASSPKDMGKVMGAAKTEIGTAADGKRISETVKKLLG